MTSLKPSHSYGSLLDVTNETLESDDGILLGEIGDMDDWPEMSNEQRENTYSLL